MHTPETHLTSETQAERERLADLFRDLSPEQWDTASLCTGWRVREVVAHMTMAARYMAWRRRRRCRALPTTRSSGILPRVEYSQRLRAVDTGHQVCICCGDT